MGKYEHGIEYRVFTLYDRVSENQVEIPVRQHAMAQRRARFIPEIRFEKGRKT